MRNTTESDAEEEQIESENSKKDFEDNFKYEELKRQIYRKYRATEKQAIRIYLEGEDPDYIAIINNKTYGNPGGKTRKRRRRSPNPAIQVRILYESDPTLHLSMILIVSRNGESSSILSITIGTHGIYIYPINIRSRSF